MNSSFRHIKHIDWLLLLFILPIIAAGMATMNSFSGVTDFFQKQLLWVAISFLVLFLFSRIDFGFLKRSNILFSLYIFFLFLLTFLFIAGSTIKGATSWFDFGGFSFQPADAMKLIVILMLAKYYSRRHVEIKNPKHIIIPALYALLPFLLIFLQPDFGSAIIVFMIWFGVTLVSGISKKHLFAIILLGVTLFSVAWFFVLAPYQQDRITSFLNPYADIQGTGYNAYQSTIAVGSGQVFGKGLGYGTQSRLQFLPEYETDFIFAAFAEEWGFMGSFLILLLFGLVLWRILRIAQVGSGNFEILFGMGVAIMFASHIIVNVGMNIGLMPITGITLPFMSYGGSHLLTEFAALGMLMGMHRYARVAHRDDLSNEFLGI